MGAESDPTAWNAYVKQIGNNPNIKNDLKLRNINNDNNNINSEEY